MIYPVKSNIIGVKIKPLNQIIDERGKIMHMLKENDALFEKFGEIYFSTIHPNAIKGWHIHSEMTINYAVVYGNIKLVLYDDRVNSVTNGNIMEIFLGQDNYYLVKIPPNIWNGFKTVGTETAIVANCSTIMHRKDEISRLDPHHNHIPYNWDVKNC